MILTTKIDHFVDYDQNFCPAVYFELFCGHQIHVEMFVESLQIIFKNYSICFFRGFSEKNSII